MPKMRSNKKRMSRKQQRRLRQQRMQLCAVVLGALCISGLFLMPLLNEQAPDGSATYTSTSDIWYVPGQEAQVAAPQVETPTPEPTHVPAGITAEDDCMLETARPEAAG